MTRQVQSLTFLFSDIEGSTQLLRNLGPDYRSVLEDHRRILLGAFAAHGGKVIGSEGDGLFVSFDDPGSALDGAREAQVALGKAKFPGGADVKVRMGIHAGDAEIYGDDLVGLAIHQAARIAAAAHGGQVLVSGATAVRADGRSFRELGRFRLKDFPEPVALSQLEASGMHDDFPPPRTTSLSAHNLPRSLTSFVGRQGEIDDVSKLISDARLVTLVGTGGAGKTRLAVEVAGRLAVDFTDGVWFVDVASVSDPSMLATACAATLGLREAGRTADDALIGHLRGSDALLIMDNCEHLIDACADLVSRLLESCGATHVLATSREPLGLDGERIHRVRPLADDGFQLFVDRATARDADFHLNEEEAVVVKRLCERLDGIPLAIEMAAALVESLPVGEIARRLDDRLKLLSGGVRRGVGRQQTMASTLDWGYDLLNDEERTVLRAVSIFSGGFSLDAAEHVAASEPLDREKVVPILARLVTKSWLAKERTSRTIRYRQLETLRQYGLQKLIDAHEAETTRHRHLQWCLAFAASAAKGTASGPEQGVWLDRVEAEIDNLRAAVDFGEGDDPLRICLALVRYFEVRGDAFEALDRLERAITGTKGEDTALLCRALAWSSFFAFYTGDTELARGRADAAVGSARAVGDRAAEGLALRFQALALWRERAEVTRPLLEMSAERSREGGSGSDLAFALQTLARVEEASNNRYLAASILERARGAAEESGDLVPLNYVLYAMAMMAMGNGDDAGARALLLRAREIASELGDRLLSVNILLGLAHVSEDSLTPQMIEEQDSWIRSTRSRRALLHWLRVWSSMRRMTGDADESRRITDEVVSLAEREGTAEARVIAHYAEGIQLAFEDDCERARAEFERGIELARASRINGELGFGYYGLARVAANECRWSDAEAMIAEAQASWKQTGRSLRGYFRRQYEELLEEIASSSR